MILQKQVLRLGNKSQIKEDFIFRPRQTKTHPWFRSLVDIVSLPVTLISSVLFTLERVHRSALENIQVWAHGIAVCVFVRWPLNAGVNESLHSQRLRDSSRSCRHIPDRCLGLKERGISASLYKEIFSFELLIVSVKVFKSRTMWTLWPPERPNYLCSDETVDPYRTL